MRIERPYVRETIFTATCMALRSARILRQSLVLELFWYFIRRYYFFCFFFFFQAEDGIRDTSVTGVQTCALPISRLVSALPRIRRIVLHAGRCGSRRARGCDCGIVVRMAGRRAGDLPGVSRREIGRASCRERVWIAVGGGR